MAAKAKRPCNRTGCRGIVADGKCSVCGPVKRQGWKSDRERGTRQERGYDEGWLRLRGAYIREHPLCEQCKDEGRVRAAEEVHHVESFEGRDDPKRLEWENLRALCGPCHDAITRGRRRATG